ncbi:MAG: potassium-transporting ATPase subunit KdpC [Acidobacteria bacterium]|nr:potassium-transporting ATPase subunit KdpC [Acidobacteriota bacterium]
MLQQLKIALRMTALLTVLTGLLYPALTTLLAQKYFPEQAEGSLLKKDGRVIGSTLIAQTFSRPEYFHPRPSAVNYDASLSGASNLGPTSQGLIDRIKVDAGKFRAENPEFTGSFPSDLLTTSGSGLDPDISPASAMTQASRVAKARGVSKAVMEGFIQDNVELRQWEILGEPRVNVLLLNLALDKQFPLKK